MQKIALYIQKQVNGSYCDCSSKEKSIVTLRGNIAYNLNPN